MSQAQAARIAGVKLDTLKSWELGDNLPRLDGLLAYLARIKAEARLLEEIRLLWYASLEPSAQENVYRGLVSNLYRDSGLSYRAVGKRIGVAPSTLEAWIGGIGPPVKDLPRLLDALQLDGDLRSQTDELLRYGTCTALPFLPSDPMEDPERFTAGPARTLSIRLAALEIYARRMALRESPDWWDWLSRFQLAAIPEFVALGAWPEAHHWAVRSKAGHPRSDRHPRTESAVAALSMVSARRGKGSDRIAKHELEWASGRRPGEGTWALCDAARRVGSEHGFEAARAVLNRAFAGSPEEYREGSFDRMGLEASVAVESGSFGEALEILAGREDFYRSQPNDVYVFLWLEGLYVRAAAHEESFQTAVRASHRFLQRCDSLGDWGRRWRRDVWEKLPLEVRQELSG